MYHVFVCAQCIMYLFVLRVTGLQADPFLRDWVGPARSNPAHGLLYLFVLADKQKNKAIEVISLIKEKKMETLREEHASMAQSSRGTK